MKRHVFFTIVCAAVLTFAASAVAHASTPKKIAIPETSASGWEIKARNGNYFMSESKVRVGSLNRDFSSIRDTASKRILKSLGTRVRFTDVPQGAGQISVQSAYPRQARSVYVVHVPRGNATERVKAVAAVANYASRGGAVGAYYKHVLGTNRVLGQRMKAENAVEASYIADYVRMSTGRDARNATVKPSHMRKLMGNLRMFAPSTQHSQTPPA